MTRRSALAGLCFIVLLFVFGFLYRQTTAINVDSYNRFVSELRELKQLDVEWNVNVLKSRVGINNNYDPVTTPLPYQHALGARIARGVRLTPGDTLDAALLKVQTAFADKEDLIEQFKSQHAVLQNSLHYFPTAVAEFKSLLARQQPAAATSDRYALETPIDRLLTDILRYNLMPGAELGERISAAIDELERHVGRYPAVLEDPLRLLIRHARVIRRQRVVDDALLARIDDVPTAGSIEALNGALDLQFRDLLQEKQRYRTYLSFYSGFLLLLLIYAAWRLMRSYQVIAQVNRHLQAANETLEQRVVERTVELERQSAQLAQLATLDALTGLVNRRQLLVQLGEALQRAKRRGWVVVLMFIDLDGFKEINDTCGHATGDLALQEVARRLRQLVRQEDCVSRLGGDEFVILLGEVGVREGALRVAEAALQELRGMTTIDGHPVHLSASIGISSVRAAADASYAPESLLIQADRAMYCAKQQGKNAYCFSQPDAWQ